MGCQTSRTQTSKRKGVIIQEPEETTTTKIASLQQSQVQDKGKGKAKLIEEPVKLKIQDQFLFDQEVARKLQEEIYEQERLIRERARQEEEANNALIETWEDIQAKKRRKFFAVKRTKEKRNRPPTKAQQKSLMCTYLKNIDGWKPRALKNKSFAEIQKLLDIAMKRINTFVDFRTELVEESSKKDKAETTQESSSKRVGNELDQERYKKQKVKDDKESEELKKCLEIILDDGDDVTINATPLSFNKMLKFFNREDLEVLWILVKDRLVKNVKLQVDDECEMAYELLRLVKKQLKEGYRPN
uniref:Uncharacterized protein n=1 Tax=Tanacetum cinerariifolium TaxID=118510 RepID=A0A6L2LL90_TANCI|nr:hypothetical protein [Tanacetum cinerariifolium]